MDEYQIEIAAEGGFATPVAADRDESHTRARFAEQVTQDAVGHLHQGMAKGRSDGCVELVGPAQQRRDPVGHHHIPIAIPIAADRVRRTVPVRRTVLQGV